MDPDIDRQISEHVLRMHRFRSTTDSMASENTQYEREDEAETNSTVFVKYNRMLHGMKTSRKRETLTIDFLKKYIHYAKHRFQPELTDEASDQIATAYAELRNASSNAKTGAETLTITSRTIETIIHLSTSHAKLKLIRQVVKSDVHAALQILNFAIYHQELNEMEERNQEWEREMERQRKADNETTSRSQQEGGRNESENVDASREREGMDIDPTGTDGNISSGRLEAFSSALGKHRHAQHIEQMTLAEIEGVVNAGVSVP